MSDPKPLKPRQLIALELLVAGASDAETIRVARCGRTTLYNWKRDATFAAQLQYRTREATESAKRVLGADLRASIEASLLATNKFKEILLNPKAPPWMQLQAAQSARKNGRHAADKLDPELRSTEAIGRNDEHRERVADQVTRQITVWENRDRFLAQLQRTEERRMQERREQRDAELLRRLNILARHGPQERAYLHGVWRRDDDAEEALEAIRREKARKDFAAAADVELKELPPPVPFKWEDVSDKFEAFVKANNAPTTEEEALAETRRMRELEYVDPNSPEGQAEQEKFDANLKVNEADYRNNVMPKAPPSPIDHRGMGVPPMSTHQEQVHMTHGPEVHATNPKVPPARKKECA